MILYTKVLSLAIKQLIGRYSDWYSDGGLNNGPFINDMNNGLSDLQVVL